MGQFLSFCRLYLKLRYLRISLLDRLILNRLLWLRSYLLILGLSVFVFLLNFELIFELICHLLQKLLRYIFMWKLFSHWINQFTRQCFQINFFFLFLNIFFILSFFSQTSRMVLLIVNQKLLSCHYLLLIQLFWLILDAAWLIFLNYWLEVLTFANCEFRWILMMLMLMLSRVVVFYQIGQRLCGYFRFWLLLDWWVCFAGYWGDAEVWLFNLAFAWTDSAHFNWIVINCEQLQGHTAMLVIVQLIQFVWLIFRIYLIFICVKILF